MTTTIESPLARLSPQQIEELGREFDPIHDEVFAELGDRDRLYTILRLAFPGGAPRPKPGPYRGGNGASTPAVNGRSRVPEPGPAGPHGSLPEQPTDGVRVAMRPRA